MPVSSHLLRHFPRRSIPALVLALAALLALADAAACRSAIPGQTGAAPTPPSPAVRTSVRVLTIGNSFSDNATEYLPQLAKAGGKQLVLAKASLGGCSLERHARLARAAQDDPESALGRAYGQAGAKFILLEALRRDKWDVVTIQQFSGDSFRPETFEPSGGQLRDLVRRLAPQAELTIHQTWAYREDSPMFKDGFTQEGMYAGLRGAYDALGKELDCRQIPTGDAFQNLRHSPGWKFERDPKFDYDHPTSGTLPSERRSINGGPYWDAKTGRFAIDPNHANLLGKYLGAAVWYEALFHDDVTRLTWAPEGIGAQDAAFLRRMAHRTVTEHLRPALPPEGSILTAPPAPTARATGDAAGGAAGAGR